MQRAARCALRALSFAFPEAPVALREDDLQGQFDDMDAYEEEQEKLSTMLKRNLTMHQMYDCNGTGKRGGQMPRGENPFQAGGMIRMD